MKIQEREYEKCGTCGHNVRLVKEEEYGCNNCGKLLYNERTHEAQYLDVTIHRHGNSSGERMEFCSWHCVVERLRMVECDYFISLPFLHFDDVPEGQRAQDFFEEIDQLFPADGVWLVDYPGAGQASRISKRSEEHTSELQSPYVISYAVFCLKKQ